MIAIVIGFFATAGAAGADFGMNARDEGDVRWGGLVGITLAVLVAGGLPLLAVAGAHGSGLTQSWDFGEVVQAIGGPIASAMLFLFAIASIPAVVLLRLHRRQQLQHHDSRACPACPARWPPPRSEFCWQSPALPPT